MKIIKHNLSAVEARKAVAAAPKVYANVVAWEGGDGEYVKISKRSALQLLSQDDGVTTCMLGECGRVWIN